MEKRVRSQRIRNRRSFFFFIVNNFFFLKRRKVKEEESQGKKEGKDFFELKDGYLVDVRIGGPLFVRPHPLATVRRWAAGASWTKNDGSNIVVGSATRITLARRPLNLNEISCRHHVHCGHFFPHFNLLKVKSYVSRKCRPSR